MSPHEAQCGQQPQPLPTDMMQQRSLILQLLKEHLQKAGDRTKFFADKKRSDRSFEVGDMVFLKLQPYKQQSVSLRSCLKLAAKFYGPFKIMKKIGTVAYKLQLPPTAKIHPAFHVSLLKKAVGQAAVAPETDLPEFCDEDCCPLEPQKVLQRRIIQRGQQKVIQWLIHWKGLTLGRIKLSLLSNFLSFSLEDKAAFYSAGIVRKVL